MKTGQKKNSGKITSLSEYCRMLDEAGKRSPSSWISVSPRIAKELNKLTNNKEDGRK